MTEFSFTKLKFGENAGDWGVRVWDGPAGLDGETVRVQTKSGADKETKLGKLIHEDRLIQLYEIAAKPKQSKLPLVGADVVPAGRYAYPDENGVWQFVKVWRKGDKVQVYATKGLEKGDRVDRRIALNAIAKHGPGLCAQEFGWRTGHCGRCGDELKLNLTRKLGMGEHCMKKVFSNETRLILTRQARADLRALGLDPAAKYDSLEGV